MITAAPSLNADQLRTVEHQGGPLLVLASPGTGKTGVLVERIAHLVADQDVNPERILALTFTVKAADEMRFRLISRLGEQALKLTITDFHSYALQIVRENAAMLNLEPDAPVLRRGRAWLMVLDKPAAKDLDGRWA